jgi:hypothetical protein
MSKVRCGATFIGVALVSLVTILMGAGTAWGNPPGVPAGLQLEFKFNLIGYPEGQEYTGNCGSGHRIFVNRDANHAHIIVRNGDDWEILDCNATADNVGELQSADLGTFDVYVRILGKPGGHLKICADQLVDITTQETLCLLGTIDLTRSSGKSMFQVQPDSIFDASLFDILWTVDTNSDFRIAEFRVYNQVP